MQITFYTFSKRSNSTKIPTDAGTSVEVKLKAGVSVENPVFIIQDYDISWNYIKWNSSYYFINDIIHINTDMVEIHAVIDSLGTYKSNILAASAFVLYSANGGSNLVDTRLGCVNFPTYDSKRTPLNTYMDSDGIIVVDVLGYNGVSSYKVSSAGLHSLYHPVTDEAWDAVLGTIDDEIDVIKKCVKQLASQGSCIDNIKGARWIPFNFTGTSELISLGNFDTTVYGERIPQGILTQQTALSIPWQFDDWRRSNPWTELYLYIPFVGIVQIPTADIQNENTMYFKTSLTPATGDFSVLVQAGGKILGTYSASTAINLAIGTSSINDTKVGSVLAKGAVGLVGGALGGGLGGAGIAAAALAKDLFGLIEPIPSSIGTISGGSSVGLGTDIICYTLARDIPSGSIDSAKSVIGAPYMQKATISTLGVGYVQTSGASVAGTMTEAERQKINAMLDNGIYIE